MCNEFICHARITNIFDISIVVQSLFSDESVSLYFVLFVCLGFNSTFSTNRLYRAITVG